MLRQYITRGKSRVSQVLSPLSKKIFIHSRPVHAMVFACLAAFLVLLFYLTGVTRAFPLKLQGGIFRNTSGLHPDQSAIYTSAEAAIEQTRYFAELVRQLRPLFSQIEGGRDGAFFDATTNVVGTNEFESRNHYQRQAYVANGYLGARIPNLGQGFTFDQLEDDSNNMAGWPLFNRRYLGAFIAGFFNIEEKLNLTNFPELYANGYESVIAAIPQWTTLTLSMDVDGQTYTLDPVHTTDETHLGNITNYVQLLLMEDGIVSTFFTWMNKLNVQLDVLAHRQEIHLGMVRLRILNVASSTQRVTVEDKLDFSTAQRCQFGKTVIDKLNLAIGITFRPHQLNYVNGAMYSKLRAANSTTAIDGGRSASQQVQLVIPPGKASQIVKYVGVVSSDIDPKVLETEDDVYDLAKSVVLLNYARSDEYLFGSHVDAWTEVLDIGSVNVTFPTDSLLTLAARASIYHLAANTRADAQGVTAALGVGGLSSDSYAGMVFWDTDLWMSGGVLPFIPLHARSFVNYRLHTLQQAKDNVPKGHDGAVYPWTSGRFGNCTSTGPCIDYEYHINVAVAYGAFQLYLAGEVDEYYLEHSVFPLVVNSATFLADYVLTYNSTYDEYTTHNLTDPDEYANHVDNGAYTNAGIHENIRWATTLCSYFNKNCTDLDTDKLEDVMRKGIHIPASSEGVDKITMEYSGMNASVAVKQADVIMLSYPLDSQLIDEEQASADLNYYSAKQVSYGPAMTFPIFSAVASKLSETGCSSQSYILKAVQPYLRAPFAQFLEQNNDDFETNGGTHPAFPFLTAHGGILQAILQGFTGLKYDFRFDNSTKKLDRLLHLDPVALPCLGGGGVEINGVMYMNQSIDLVIGADNFTLRHNGPKPITGDTNLPLDIKFYLGLRNDMSHGMKVHTLQPYDEVTIPLYRTKPTIANSVSECGGAIFTNITVGTYGDISSMMNDGDNTTYWQAAEAQEPAQVLIDLKQRKSIKSGAVNWGDRPAKSLSISVFNASQDAFTIDEILKVEKLHTLSHLDKYFEQVAKLDVNITAPFNYTKFMQIGLVTDFNVTHFKFEHDWSSRFMLLELEGVLDNVTNSTLGATINEVMLFE